MTDEFIRDIYNRCKSNNDDFLALNSIALTRIDKMRCSLSSACKDLYDEIVSACEEYCDKHNIDIEDTDIDIEEIFWSDAWGDCYGEE